MRRVAVVASVADAAASGRESVPAQEWLGSLPTGGVSWLDRLADVPLADMDVLWVRAEVEPDPRLTGWLHAGGRLLVTHHATLLPTALGLEAEPPTLINLAPSLPGGFGLAGFGPHPLFTGLRDGAMLGPAPEAGGRTMRCYDGVRPGRAGVVAVERRELELQAERILAWEYAVGAGGVLCLAFEPAFPAHESLGSRREAEVVLANAIVGEAIPHRDRASPVSLWPPPGMCAAGDASGTPLLLAPTDPWPASSTPALDVPPAAPWAHAGRRLLVSAPPGTSRREVWAPPFRLMHSAAVRDAIPCAPWHLAADEVAGGLALGGFRLQERWMAAPDVPVVVWEIGGQSGLEMTAEWTVDLRRAWPYPAGSYGDLAFTLAADGRSLRVVAEGGPRALFGVAGGELAVEASPSAPEIRVRCTGATPLRIVAVAGVDEEELRRSLRTLERGGVHELAAARARRAAQLHRYGTAFEAPDDALARGFEWARERGDEALVGAPGVGRSLLAPCPRAAGEAAWCFGAQACAAAAAQLVAGNRDPARELLKFLAQSQHPGGGIAAHHPLGGLASSPDGPSTVAFLDLAARLLAWTGELEALRRLSEALAGALEYLAEGDGPVPSARVLDGIDLLVDGGGAGLTLAALRRRPGDARLTAEVEAHAVVEAAAAALRRAPGALPGTGAAPALLEAVAALWGLEPNAPDDALALVPALPAGWDGFALRRLRIGRSRLDLEVRRRPRAVVVRVAHLFGPRLVLTVGVRGVDVEGTEVDDVALPGARARFETHDRHEVRFLLRE
jgi:hypothetical protein